MALRERRGELIAHAALERESAARLVASLESVAGWFDRGRDALTALRRHPEIVAAALAFLVAWRPRRMLSLGLTAFSLWRNWRRLRDLAARFAARFAA